MAVNKEIRSKIKSVSNTQKITRAMQMVATSKMRKTQEKMQKARPYALNIRRVMSNIAGMNKALQQESSFLRSFNKMKNVSIILITTDKGLCGGLNTNAIKMYFEKLKNFKATNINVETCALGQKAYSAAKRVKAPVISSTVNLGDTPSMAKLVGPVSILLKKFRCGEMDAIFIIYTSFKNTMTHTPVYEQLLPLQNTHLEAKLNMNSNYIFEDTASNVLDSIIERYIESVVYQCLADNMASEQAARMIAMKSATENANDVLKKLRLNYNKLRQAEITEEISEIVSGNNYHY